MSKRIRATNFGAFDPYRIPRPLMGGIVPAKSANVLPRPPRAVGNCPQERLLDHEFPPAFATSRGKSQLVIQF